VILGAACGEERTEHRLAQGDDRVRPGHASAVTTRSAKAAFSGRWRLSWTRVWSKDALDLVEPAFIEFKRKSDADLGAFVMIALTGSLHCC
jgi:hypothetical protein